MGYRGCIKERKAALETLHWREVRRMYIGCIRER